MSRSILYYPSMDIKDGVWLRNAMLYWDKIHSIVPNQFNPTYSPEVQALEERGMYLPITPDELFYSIENKVFSNEVIHKIRGLNPKYRKINKRGMKALQLPQIGTMIHYKKIPTDLYDLMTSWGLLHIDGEWIEMEETAANIYMSTLAEYLVKIRSEDMIIGTDKNSYVYQAYEKQWKSQQSMCLTSVFEKAMPTPNLDISFETILDFREKRESELLHLRKEIRDFENSLSACLSWQEIKASTNTFREKWECELLGMDKLLKDHRIRYRMGNMKSLIEITGGAVGLMQFTNDNLHSFPKWVIGAGLVTAGVIGVGTNFVNHRVSLKEYRNNASFAYLYDAAEQGILRRGSFVELI
ncbi:MAG: DUF6236 family protein [Lachnospiraceae bacterium]|nr:DUF6236 family protein [Lachnospiraceae bacterium]